LELNEKVTLQDVVDKFDQWLYMEEPARQTLKIVLATAISNIALGDPLWFFIVAPSSTLKTELLRTFEGHPLCEDVDTLTPKAFGSGLKTKEKDPSLAKILNGKIWVIWDFSTMLGIRKEDRETIFSTMRTMYDGKYSKGFGTGRERWKVKFTLLAGVTPEIDRIHQMHNALGERFLKVRIYYKDRKALIKKAQQNAGKEEIYRAELRYVVQSFITSKMKDFSEINHPTIPPEIIEGINNLADFVSSCRTTVQREWYDKAVEYIPQAEAGGRLIKQFMKLIRAIGYLDGVKEVTGEHYKLIYKVALDSLTDKTRRAIEILYKETQEHYIETQSVANKMGLDTGSARIICDDLFILGIAHKEIESSNHFSWKLKSDFRQLWDSCKPEGITNGAPIFEPTEPPISPEEDILF